MLMHSFAKPLVEAELAQQSLYHGYGSEYKAR